MDPATLVGRPLQHATKRRDEAGVLIGDDELHPGQPPATEVAQERPGIRVLSGR